MEKLMYKKDFTIESERIDVDFFIWKCPYCGKENRDIEFGVRDNELYCSKCDTMFKYEWE